MVNIGLIKWNIWTHKNQVLFRKSITTLILSNVLANIKEIPIPSSPSEDRFFLGFSQDGRFTIKSTTL